MVDVRSLPHPLAGVVGMTLFSKVAHVAQPRRDPRETIIISACALSSFLRVRSRSLGAIPIPNPPALALLLLISRSKIQTAA